MSYDCSRCGFHGEYGDLDPRAQELKNLKAVMSDLIQERIVGRNVYSVEHRSSPFDTEPLIHLSLESAQAWVAKNREDLVDGAIAPAWRSISIVPLLEGGQVNFWQSGDDYTITEHTLHLETL